MKEFELKIKAVYEEYTQIAINYANQLGEEVRELMIDHLNEADFDNGFKIIGKYEEKMNRDIQRSLQDDD